MKTFMNVSQQFTKQQNKSITREGLELIDSNNKYTYQELLHGSKSRRTSVRSYTMLLVSYAHVTTCGYILENRTYILTPPLVYCSSFS